MLAGSLAALMLRAQRAPRPTAAQCRSLALAALEVVMAFPPSARWRFARRAGDLYLLGGVVVCAIGYAEGGVLARTLGARQTICWALVLALPLTVPVALVIAPSRLPAATALIGFAYVGVGSMFVGFFAWYGGLARGGVARVSQVQLGQTPLTLVWRALVLGERVGWGTGAVAAAVVACVAISQRARIRRRID